MSKHAVDTLALNALLEALRTSSDLPAKEVAKLTDAVTKTAVEVTITQSKVEDSVVNTDQNSS